MTSEHAGVRTTMRPLAALLTTILVVAACNAASAPTPSPSATVSPTPVATVRPSASPSGSPSPEPSPSPTPSPTPGTFEHLSGVATSPELAGRFPIAVMLDDSPAARPQSGLYTASVVWQAPAEGGIPRYMAVFQSGSATRIGPVRSARLYFVRWASESGAVYAHFGGPPPLRAYLDAGKGGVVNIDAQTTGGETFRRVIWRKEPHNSYTSYSRLLALADRRGVSDDKLGYDPATWQQFRDGAPAADRGPDGATLTVRYTSERIDYRYDRASNTWLRSVDGTEHRDPEGADNGGYGAPTDGPRLAPTTVIVMVVPIRRSSSIDGPALGRLEADVIGGNDAWIFADGYVQKARWEKSSATSRTRFLDSSGIEIVLPRGQLFVQVIPGASAFASKVDSAP